MVFHRPRGLCRILAEARKLVLWVVEVARLVAFLEVVEVGVAERAVATAEGAVLAVVADPAVCGGIRVRDYRTYGTSHQLFRLYSAHSGWRLMRASFLAMLAEKRVPQMYASTIAGIQCQASSAKLA